MAESVQGELLLACKDCRRVVAVTYHSAHHAQGLVDLDEHRACAGCGKEMQETERGPHGRVLMPGEED